MARVTLDRNVKFKRLVAVLGLPRPYVRGLLETMWDCANECGNPVLGDPEHVEAACEWPGEAGALFSALRNGWLDEVSEGQWGIHDYWDHCPDYVKKRRIRELEREDRGSTLERSADNGGQRRTTADNGHTRAPAPTPTPINPPSGGSSSAAPKIPPCPHREIVALYHEILPELPVVKVWDERREGYLRSRWKENPKRQSLDWWRKFFSAVRESDFLMGRTEGRGGRPFRCTLEWLVRPTNFVKVIEGAYFDSAG